MVAREPRRRQPITRHSRRAPGSTLRTLDALGRERQYLQAIPADRLAARLASPVQPGVEAIERVVDLMQFERGLAIETLERLAVAELASPFFGVGWQWFLAMVQVPVDTLQTRSEA